MSAVRHYPACNNYLSFKNWTPFHHGRCETCNQRSQEQEISWARWHPPEILKHGGKPLLTVLFRIFTICWNRRCLLDDFRDSKIITLYKNKGDRRDCNNYRGIPLLCIAGKVFARLLLPRVRQIADRILPESQCGFRPSKKHMRHGIFTKTAPRKKH